MTVYPSPDEDPLGPAPSPRRRGRAVLAALLVVAVGSGAGAWYVFGRSGGVRGDGTVPLITADTQPYKFRPEDPGGYTVPNQDRMVFDRLHPGTAPRTVERLLPPPEAPLSRPAPPPPPAQALPVAPPLVASTPPAAPAPAAEPVAPPPSAVSSTPSAQRPAPGPLPEGSPQLPALPRPGVSVDAGAPQPSPPSQTAAVAPPPSLGALGARRSRLQLGSLGSEDAARSEWQRLSRRFPDALGDLAPSYQQARVGERTVVRLIAGPVDDIRALAICDELKSANAPCIIVRP